MSLENRLPPIPKRLFAGRQIKQPQAHNSYIIKRTHVIFVFDEAVEPMSQGIGMVKPPAFGVRQLQHSIFNGCRDFGKRRNIAAREDEFCDPGVRGIRRCCLAIIAMIVPECSAKRSMRLTHFAASGPLCCP